MMPSMTITMSISMLGIVMPVISLGLIIMVLIVALIVSWFVTIVMAVIFIANHYIEWIMSVADFSINTTSKTICGKRQ